MGVCASRTGKQEDSKEGGSLQKNSFSGVDPCSLGFKALSFDSPGSSAEVGEIGKLGTLLCRKRSCNVVIGGFGKNHHEMLLHSCSSSSSRRRRRRSPLGSLVGELSSLTSYLQQSSPSLVREQLDIHELEAIAKAYAESAAKAAAHDIFMFLKENDQLLAAAPAAAASPSPEEDEDVDSEQAEAAEVENGVVETMQSSSATAEENSHSQFEQMDQPVLDLGRSASAIHEQELVLEGCSFEYVPAAAATTRSSGGSSWASVVNAAGQSSSAAASCLAATTKPLRLPNVDRVSPAAAAVSCLRVSTVGLVSPEDRHHAAAATTDVVEDLEENQGCLACFSLANGLRLNLLTACSNSSSCQAAVRAAAAAAAACCRGNSSDCRTHEQRPDDADADADAFFSFPSSPASAAHHHHHHHFEEAILGSSARKLNSDQQRQQVQCFDMELRSSSSTESSSSSSSRTEENLSARSAASNAAFSKGAFGSPFPVLWGGGTTNYSSWKADDLQPAAGAAGGTTNKLRLQGFSQLEDQGRGACSTTTRAATLACNNSVASDSITSTATTEPDSPQTSSSNEDLGIRDVHDDDDDDDGDDSSSDLFEIGNIQNGGGSSSSLIMGFTGLDFPCLPIKKNFTSAKEVSEISASSSGRFFSAPFCDSGSVRNLMRGAKAVHVANRRAKVLKEQARVKAKSAELVKAVIGGDATKSGQQGKGLVLMKDGRLRQKDLAVKKCNREAKHSRLSR
ncbi:unnamed protein product [Sphagnum compactum]